MENADQIIGLGQIYLVVCGEARNDFGAAASVEDGEHDLTFHPTKIGLPFVSLWQALCVLVLHGLMLSQFGEDCVEFLRLDACERLHELLDIFLCFEVGDEISVGLVLTFVAVSVAAVLEK